MAQQPAQLDPAVRKHGHAQAQSGINAAVRKLGLDRNEAQGSVKIAAIQPAAKEAARDLGLADNQTALLEIARQPAETQVSKATWCKALAPARCNE